MLFSALNGNQPLQDILSVTVQDEIDLQMHKRLDCGTITFEGFGLVENCFTNCIQQCLKCEPLLAVALSAVQLHHNEFHNAIAMNERQTLSLS